MWKRTQEKSVFNLMLRRDLWCHGFQAVFSSTVIYCTGISKSTKIYLQTTTLLRHSTLWIIVIIIPETSQVDLPQN